MLSRVSSMENHNILVSASLGLFSVLFLIGLSLGLGRTVGFSLLSVC